MPSWDSDVRNGRSKALRIPRKFELATEVVAIQCEEGCLVVERFGRAPARGRGVEKRGAPARAGRSARGEAGGGAYSGCGTMRR